jgi:hypothetical protein
MNRRAFLTDSKSLLLLFGSNFLFGCVSIPSTQDTLAA